MAGPLQTLAAVKARNGALLSTISSKSRPVLVVFGGTSGIGAGIAHAFASHTKGNIHIIVLGRSQEAATNIFASLPQHPDSLYEFLSLDGRLMSSTRAACSQIKSKVDKINYLVLSQGAVLFNNPPTQEGLDPMQALTIYGRVCASLELVGLLEEAKRRGEDAHVLNVARAGLGGPVDLDDLGMKQTRFWQFRGRLVTYVDVGTLELARLHPTVSFTHVYPGSVKSNLRRTLPFPIYQIFSLVAYFLFISPEECGEWMTSVLLDSPDGGGAHFRGNNGQVWAASPYALDDTTREVLWRWIKRCAEVGSDSDAHGGAAAAA